MPYVVLGVPAPAPSWLIERARAGAAKAPPPFSPELLARRTIHFANQPAMLASAA